MHVAVAQLLASQDKPSNRQQALRAVDTAADQGAELVVLPEVTMAGFGGPETPLLPAAEEISGPFVESLAQVARHRRATVVAGMFEPADGGRVYNTVVVVGPSGLLGTYRKLHLFDALGWKESARVAPGDPAAGGLVVDLAEHRLGVMTCYDLRFPELARVLVDQGATILAVPAAWVAGPGKADQWKTLLRARAIESTAFVAAADQPGPGFSGHSMLIDPAGLVLMELDSDQPGAVSAVDLTRSRLDEVRRALPALDHRRFEVRPRP